MVAVLTFQRLPLAALIVVRKMVICRVAVYRRAEYLRVRIDSFHGRRSRRGLFNKLRNGHRIGMHARMGIMPQGRLIVQTVSPDASFRSRRSYFLCTYSSMYTAPSVRSGVAVKVPFFAGSTSSHREDGAVSSSVTLPFVSADT